MSGSLYSDEQNARDVFLLASVMQTTGAAQLLYFKVPVACTITSFTYAVDTEGNADNVHNAELRTGTTVLFAAGPTAPDTVAEDTEVASGQSASRDKGETLNIKIDAPTGTTAASTGGHVQVWAIRR